jgi:2-polyprenyl-3-methyl-5-hydroxy-6-metoxy-1,4-benzoquinol methylase
VTSSETNRIAKAFDSRWQRHYVASKLRTDPVYQAIAGQLDASPLPVLDIGCGLGLLAFYLRAHGVTSPFLGVDFDAPKISAARLAAAKLGAEHTEFRTTDVQTGIPHHSGNVCILDVLQYLTPEGQAELLTEAALRVPAGGVLAIRSGLRDDSTRFKVTVAGDLFAKATFWMKSAPKHYPRAGDFERILSPFGNVEVRPLWGNTPFNNHLITLRR